MTKQNKENDQARKQLRQLKDKHQLTWPQMAKVFERSLSAIEDWYQDKQNTPKPYKILIKTYLDNPQIFLKQISSTSKK